VRERAIADTLTTSASAMISETDSFALGEPCQTKEIDFGAQMFGYFDVPGQNYRMMNAIFNIDVRLGDVNLFLYSAWEKKCFHFSLGFRIKKAADMKCRPLMAEIQRSRINNAKSTRFRAPVVKTKISCRSCHSCCSNMLSRIVRRRAR
jgi:hypothetical protein